MKKFLLIIGTVILVLFIAYLILDEPIPDGQRGPEAEALAEKMMVAVGAEEWREIPFVTWSFRGTNHYVWDKRNHVAQIKWDDYEVILDLNEVSGKAFREGLELQGEELDSAIETAWSYWCNDSFWLNAPAKAMDPGTVRKVVEGESGDDQLLVQYESGGVTPGDAYLWILDDQHRPTAYKMWVSIIPIGGVKATWGGWKEFDGAWLATEHKMGPMEIPVGDIKVGQSPGDFDLPGDYFLSVIEK